MAVIGTKTCFPQAKFAFPRSYILDVGVRAGAATAIWSGRQVDLVNSTTGVLFWRTVFAEKFWPWSSNRYTLDYVAEECYYFPTIVSPPTPLNVRIWYETHPVTFNPMVVISPFAAQPFLYSTPTLPAPSSYWWPP